MVKYVDYVVRRKYSGKIIEVKVRDGIVDGRRSTFVRCDYVNCGGGISNASDERINSEIEKKFQIAQESIDRDKEKCLVRKISKLFR